MRKIIIVISMALFLPTVKSSLRADILDELKYIDEKSDILFYMNVNSLINFINKQNISLNDIEKLILEEPVNEVNSLIRDLSLKPRDLDGILLTGYTGNLLKKNQLLLIIKANRDVGPVPDRYFKKSYKSINNILYSLDDSASRYFTTIGNLLILGDKNTLESYLERRSSGKDIVHIRITDFKKNSGDKVIYSVLIFSGELKSSFEQALKSGIVSGRGLSDNSFINSIFSIEKIDFSLKLGDRIILDSGIYGTKIEDTRHLLMLTHSCIVGTSIILSLGDMMTSKNRNNRLGDITPGDPAILKWFQEALARIDVNRSDKTIYISFSTTEFETEMLASAMKKELERDIKEMGERIERKKISRFNKLITESNVSEIKKLISEKININGFDSDGNTPLAVASLNGNISICALLLENGAGINIPSLDTSLPIHFAVKSGKKEIVEFLLTKGGDVNARGDNELTPLHYNGLIGNPEITRLLLEKGARINAKASDGNTPLHYAAMEGNLDIVKILIEKEADTQLTNSQEQRAIDAAAYNHQTEIVDYMKSKLKQEPKETVQNGDDKDQDDEYDYGNDSDSDNPEIQDKGVFPDDEYE